jgi:hypothetical protein
MNIQADLLTKELALITANLDDGALLKIQNMLTHPRQASLLFSSQASRTQLQLISSKLRPYLLKSQVYNSIHNFLSRSDGETCKLVCDIMGNIVWTDKNSVKIFGLNKRDMENSNFFDLIAEASKQHLSKVFGEELMKNTKSTVISYLLKDLKTTLTSRCTTVLYTDNCSETRYGVLIHTRFSRHFISICKSRLMCVPFNWAVPDDVPTPLTPDITFSPGTMISFPQKTAGFKSIYSPAASYPVRQDFISTGAELSFGAEGSVENINISPFFVSRNSPDPKKKVKLSDIPVSIYASDFKVDDE